MNLLDLPPDVRPRERLLACGPAALSDAELLALLLRTGMAGQGVLALAQSLLDAFGGLASLMHADAASLGRVRGLGGMAKRTQLLAVLELAKRVIAEPLRQRPVIDSIETLQHYVQLQLGHRPHEVFAVLFLDSQHRLIALEEMFRGTLNQASVYPREVVTRALQLDSAAVVLAHNHPSGHVQPSHADESLTRALVAALGLVDVRVLDHIIVARGQSLSMVREGRL